MRVPRRTRRDWIVDITCVVLSAVTGGLGLVFTPDLSGPESLLDVTLGIVACVAIWFRRRWPLAVGLVVIVAVPFSAAAGTAAAIALFTVAVHRHARTAVPVTALYIVVNVGYALLRPTPGAPVWLFAILSALTGAALLVWGLYVRARRQLVGSLRERAERAEAEQALRAEQARLAERTRIAGEMHDVLGHRISLIALHAGGLGLHDGLPAEQVTRSAGMIETTAREALSELRDIVGVLRDGSSDGDAARPGMGDIPHLVEDSRRAGAQIALELRVDDAGTIPDQLGRAAYRIVQEGLTNVHRHARGAATTVHLEGGPDRGLRVAVSNRQPLGNGTTPAWSGSGLGLIGLTERVTLAGGTLAHGTEPDGGFAVRADLPWRA